MELERERCKERCEVRSAEEKNEDLFVKRILLMKIIDKIKNASLAQNKNPGTSYICYHNFAGAQAGIINLWIYYGYFPRRIFCPLRQAVEKLCNKVWWYALQDQKINIKYPEARGPLSP